MIRRRGLWYGLAALVAMVAVVFSASGMVAWLVQRQAVDTQSYAGDRITEVDVIAPSATIQVHAVPADRAKVTTTLQWVSSRPKVYQQFDPTTGALRLEYNCDGLKFLPDFGCSIALDIAVPAEAAVNVTGDSGATTVTGMTGPVSVLVSSGSITLQGVSGPVTAKTDSGDVEGDSLRSPAVSATAASGSVNLDFATPPASVTAGVDSGSVNVQVPRGTRYRVRANSTDGSADVDPALASGSAQGTITASATSGSVTVGYRAAASAPPPTSASATPNRLPTVGAPPSGQSRAG